MGGEGREPELKLKLELDEPSHLVGVGIACVA